jgi:FdhD protein
MLQRVASSLVEREIVRAGPDRGGRAGERDRDLVVVEAPLELRLAATGRPLSVTMRTPGHDLELARGLLFAEGVIRADEAAAVRRPDPAELAPDERVDLDNLVAIDLDPALVESRWPGRALAATAACGVCGAASIAALELRAAPVRSTATVAAGRVADLPDRLRAAQTVFDATGGLHAAGLFTAAADRGAEELLVAREDVGRHNAVDKVVGWALDRGRLPLAGAILCVSGRLGFEIAHKAATAGIPIVVAVSAPSSLAIDLAERFRVTLCGFTRGGRFNLYSHPSRITP